MKKGNLVIVGGALSNRNASVYEKFIELAGGKDKAKIGIVPAASSNPVKKASKFKDNLVSYGVLAENIEVIPLAVKDKAEGIKVNEHPWLNNGFNPEVVEQVSKLSGIWFTGGDQNYITHTLLDKNLHPSPVLNGIYELYKNGGVIGGSSAGAAIMSNVMIGGGTSWEALTQGFTDTYYEVDSSEKNRALYVTQGLGFFPYGIIDQHFDRMARTGRLISLCYAKQSLGFGIDENTAFVIYGDGKPAEILGEGCVTVIDVSQTFASEVNGLTRFKNVSLSILSHGDSYDCENHRFVIHPEKQSTIGHEYCFVSQPRATGVFSRNGLLRDLVGYDLLDNAGSQTAKSYLFGEDGMGFELNFYQNNETQGYWSTQQGHSDTYSIIELSLDIDPIKVNIEYL